MDKPLILIRGGLKIIFSVFADEEIIFRGKVILF